MSNSKFNFNEESKISVQNLDTSGQFGGKDVNDSPKNVNLKNVSTTKLELSNISHNYIDQLNEKN